MQLVDGGEPPWPPAAGAHVEATIAGMDSQGRALVLAANVGGERAQRTVQLRDVEDETLTDADGVELAPLATRRLRMERAEVVQLEVGTTSIGVNLRA